MAEILVVWKYLNSNESSIDLLSLILSAAANLISEVSDILKKDDLKLIISLIPNSVTMIKNNTTMLPVVKHKSAVSLQKLLRSMLLIREDKIFDIIDYICKIGSTDSCVTLFDTWKSLSLFSFIKHNRDAGRLNKIISDRIDMLIPKLFAVSETMSIGSKLLVQHHYRHSLYLHMRYTQDVNFFNNPVIRVETESLMNYIQDTSPSWPKGLFDYNSEEAIWKFLYSNIKPKETQSPLFSLPVQISPVLKSSFVSMIHDELIAFKKFADELDSRNDTASLQHLCEYFQSYPK